MSCAPFDPNLPFQTTLEKAVWLTRWTTNLLNSSCLQTSCGHACLPGNSFSSDSCRSCLKQAKCDQTLFCINCVGLDTNDFTQVYQCTHAPGLSLGEIIGIVVASVVGALLIVFLVMLILYKLNKLPIRTKLWIDRIGKQENLTRPNETEIIQQTSRDFLIENNYS